MSSSVTTPLVNHNSAGKRRVFCETIVKCQCHLLTFYHQPAIPARQNFKKSNVSYPAWFFSPRGDFKSDWLGNERVRLWCVVVRTAVTSGVPPPYKPPNMACLGEIYQCNNRGLWLDTRSLWQRWYKTKNSHSIIAGGVWKRNVWVIVRTPDSALHTDTTTQWGTSRQTDRNGNPPNTKKENNNH